MEARRVEAGYRTGEQTTALQTNDPLKSVQQLDDNYQDDNVMRVVFVDGDPIPEEDLLLLTQEAEKTSKMTRADVPPPALGDGNDNAASGLHAADVPPLPLGNSAEDSPLDTEMTPTPLNSTSISDNSKRISKTLSVSAPIVI
jgi:hypothetical protein